MTLKKTRFYSYRQGKLAKGCQLCVKGKKLVLFITGLCPRRCRYCPISEQKKNKDVIFANETPVKNDNDIIKEAKACSSAGMGITGGDPLAKLERTCHVIKLMKKKFGKKFHIHLYTSLDLVNKNNLNKLYKAGLDEIRFHMDIDSSKLWNKLIIANDFRWDVGVEIPVIPGKKEKTTKLINFIKDKIKFLNLNELEFSDTNAYNLKGFKTKDSFSYAVKGSEELAFEIIKKFPRLNIHYCTTTLKDKVQLAERIKLRSKNTSLPTDKILKDGTLVRGVVYLEKPGTGYRKKLKLLTKNQRETRLKKLEILRKEINKRFKLKNKVFTDSFKLRLLTSKKLIKSISKNIPNCAVVIEYPTYDGFELEINFLS